MYTVLNMSIFLSSGTGKVFALVFVHFCAGFEWLSGCLLSHRPGNSGARGVSHRRPLA